MKWIVLAVVTAAMSKASPIENGVQDLVKRASSAEVANFDDLPDPNTGSSTVPTPYKGLNYFGAYLTNPNVPSAPPPIIPNSSPYYVTGQAGKGLGVATDGTTTESFKLDSFYVGCFDARDQEVLYCNFTVTGFNAADERHQGPYLFTFDEPITDFKAPMEKFSVHWTGLEAFDLRVIADDATLARTVLVMDSVEYTINT